MREILFRGKRIDNGEWIEGGFRCEKIGNYLVAAFISESLGHGVCNIHRVDPYTVGQYTGLTDKNGKKIFEGDIVGILTENEEIGVVEYEDGGFLVSADVFFCVDFHSNINGNDLEVIGNIHDNPELLKGGAENG